MIARLRRAAAGSVPWVLLGVVSFAGCLAVVLMTRWGPGLSPDSASYLGGANSLRAGYGFTIPLADGASLRITHFPPGFPALITLVSLVGLPSVTAAKWLNAVLFGANLFLIGLLVSRSTGTAGRQVSWRVPAAAFFALTSTTLLNMHSMVWSEPAFFFFWLLGVVMLVDYVRTLRRRLLIASAGCAAVVLLTRYAGLPAVLALVMALLVVDRQPWRRRATDAALVVVIALAPLLLWFARNVRIAGAPTDRTVTWQPLAGEEWRQAFETVTSWLLIPVARIPFAATVTILVATALILAAKTIVDARPTPDVGRLATSGLALIMGLFVVLYGAFICASLMLLDHATPLDGRILSPLFVAGVVIFFQGQRWPGFSRRPLVRYGVAFCVCAFAFRTAVNGALFVRAGYDNGFGYNDVTWRHSELLHSIADLPGDVIVYSNASEAIFLRTGRPIATVPMTRRYNPEYDVDVERLTSRLRTRGAVVAYFRDVKRSWLSSEDELLSQLPLRVRALTSDGIMYGVEPCTPDCRPADR